MGLRYRLVQSVGYVAYRVSVYGFAQTAASEASKLCAKSLHQP